MPKAHRHQLSILFVIHIKRTRNAINKVKKHEFLLSYESILFHVSCDKRLTKRETKLTPLVVRFGRVRRADADRVLALLARVVVAAAFIRPLAGECELGERFQTSTGVGIVKGRVRRVGRRGRDAAYGLLRYGGLVGRKVRRARVRARVPQVKMEDELLDPRAIFKA